MGTLVDDDGDAGSAEGVEVAVDGALGHLQAAGEHPGGHPAVGLQQEEDREEPVCTHDPKIPQDI